MGTIGVAAGTVRRPARRRPGWLVVFVAAELLLLLLVVTGWITALLPRGMATQVSHNSEAFALAALLSIEIDWVRRRRPGAAAGRARAVLVGTAGLAALGALLLALDEAALHTLNEAVFAAAILFPYCAVRPRRRAFVLASVALLALTVLLSGTDLVRLQAESVVALVLAPWGLDLFARRVLVPGAAEDVAPAVAWTAFLCLTPFALMATGAGPIGPLPASLMEYAARGNEAFWGLGAVHLLALLAWRRPPTPVHVEGVRTSR